MRPLRLWAAILSIPASACITGANEAASDGWGNYTFGMTPDDVRAVRGVSLSQPELGEFLGTRFVVLRALKTVSFDGLDYELFLYFTPQEQGWVRLAWIDLFDERSSVSPLQCESDFQSALRGLEKRHGALSPPLPDIFADAGVVSEESKPLPNAISNYVVKKRDPSIHVLQATTVLDSMTVSIEANEGPLNVSTVGQCNVRVTYQDR